IRPASRIRELSKGMVVQLHLAIVMASDARLLVLDEPTLGLDILFRKQFYDSLLDDYFDRSRTILVTTHQVEEVQDVLTDLMFIDHGRIVLSGSMEELEARYAEVLVRPEKVEAARALGPIDERRRLGRTIMIFDGKRTAAGDPYDALGEVRTPGIADLFVAVIGRNGAEGGRGDDAV
ncbi:MAG TPA: ABC transporter ATP-binding protein, partial [Thermoanaerobaculia bacterium]